MGGVGCIAALPLKRLDFWLLFINEKVTPVWRRQGLVGKITYLFIEMFNNEKMISILSSIVI